MHCRWAGATDAAASSGWQASGYTAPTPPAGSDGSCSAAASSSGREATPLGPPGAVLPEEVYSQHASAQQVAGALAAAGMLGHPLTAPAVAWAMLQGWLDTRDPQAQRQVGWGAWRAAEGVRAWLAGQAGPPGAKASVAGCAVLRIDGLGGLKLSPSSAHTNRPPPQITPPPPPKYLPAPMSQKICASRGRCLDR